MSVLHILDEAEHTHRNRTYIFLLIAAACYDRVYPVLQESSKLFNLVVFPVIHSTY